MKGDCEMNVSSRKIYLDILRIFATFAVISIHVIAEPWLQLDVTSSEWATVNWYHSSTRWAVPLFIMISGALFLNPDKEINIKNLYTKNILRILCAFAFWSILYAVVNYTSITDFITNSLTGHYHLWFCYMIIGIYIMLPIIRKLSAAKDVMKYFLIVVFIFQFLVPDIIRELQQQYYNDWLLGLGNAANNIFSNAGITPVTCCVAYFIFGYFFSTTELSKKKRIAIYILGVYGIIATSLYTHIFSVFQKCPRNIYHAANTTNVLFATIGIFCFAKYELSKIRFSHKMQAALETISNYSFGIYLSHALCIEIIMLLGFNALTFHPSISTPIMILLTYLLSLALSAILNNIPFLKKYIV